MKQTWNHRGSSSENNNVAYPELLTGNAFTSACNSETHWQKKSFKLRMYGPEGCFLQRKYFWYLVILLNNNLCLGNSNLRFHRLNHFLQQLVSDCRQLYPFGQWSCGRHSATKSCMNSLVPCGCALGPPLTQNFTTRGSQMRWDALPVGNAAQVPCCLWLQMHPMQQEKIQPTVYEYYSKITYRSSCKMLKHCRTSTRTEIRYRKAGICFADTIIKEL